MRIIIKLFLVSFFVSNFLASNVFSANISKNKFVIVLDPGHGGKDPGAVGYKNLYEKNINLAVVNRVKKLIDLVPGWKAMRTRTYDKTLSLNSRVDLAKKWRANLFVSVHADAVKGNSNAQGISVYIARYPNIKLKDRKYLNNFNKTFASNLIRELDKVTPVHKAKVQKAGFIVLKVPMPAVLIELGFMTHKQESQLLASSNYQMRLAWAIFDAIQDSYSFYIKHPIKYKTDYSYKGYLYALPKYFRYTVKKGDTLSGIANKFELSVAQLKCFINKKNNNIYIGDKIKVPLQGMHHKC